ncbi:zinc-dependent metalloprotease [Ferrimonas balearica]|uniref:zinc-dependent metalloprotease n=1 Tax=Ferrimonas balearica TaxID=44012 RepID=UPI001C99BC24|nr:zinc-dependent metalloprotease [Ferrimonas balearica]MBY5922375.1 zinc-dependent metalloprotease [Ferrimonas balearica]MBY5995359.1 zinc-dependent metalloprotease [Ferrimonas balearica]
MFARIAWLLLALVLSTAARAEESPFLNLSLDDEGQVLLELPPLNTPLLMVTSLPHGAGSNDIGLDRGQLGSRRLVQFERHGNRLLLRELNTTYRAQSDNPAEQAALTQAFAESVLWVGQIEQNKANLDALLFSDLHGIAARLQATGQGHFSLDTSRSLVLAGSVKGFPKNADLDLQLTFVSAEPGAYVQQVTPDPTLLSLKVRLSFVALPEVPMTPRRFHPESGFFDYGYQDYAASLSEPMTVRYLPRHRLEKVLPGTEPSEVKAPIVYYLDPGTPEPMRSALLDGARWWAEAFEAAGFLNAYRVELLPEGADPQDIRYNIIQWVHRATRGWSYGDALVDPRSGEILKGHVTLGSLRVRQDHKIFRGLTAGWADREAALAAAEEAALARLRQLSAHEVGHTLGLAHNFAASASGDASVLDYPHPNLQLDGEKVVLEQAYGVGLSPWDKHAIAFGYGVYDAPEATAQAELAEQAREAGLRFISDPDARGASAAHPQAHLWDNGTDPVTRLEEILAIRALALAELGPQALLPGEPLSALGDLLVPIYLMQRYQVEAASRLIGGVSYDYSGQSPSAVAPEYQQAALESLLRALSPEVLALPAELAAQWSPLAYGSVADREQFGSRLGTVPDLIGLAEVASRQVLEQLLNPTRMNRLAQQQWLDSELPGPQWLLDALSEVVLESEGDSGLAGAARARSQAVLVDSYLTLYRDNQATSEVKALVRARILADAEQLERRARRAPDRDAAHFRLLAEVMRTGLTDPEVRVIAEPLPLPPGSPI